MPGSASRKVRIQIARVDSDGLAKVVYGAVEFSLGLPSHSAIVVDRCVEEICHNYSIIIRRSVLLIAIEAQAAALLSVRADEARVDLNGFAEVSNSRIQITRFVALNATLQVMGRGIGRLCSSAGNQSGP